MSTTLGDFKKGFLYPFRAIVFIFRHRLWLLTGIAVFVHLAILTLLIAFLFWSVWPLLDQARHFFYSFGEGRPVLAGLLSFLGWTITILSLTLLFIFGAVLTLLMGRITASPFLDILSEKVEELATGIPSNRLTIKLLLRNLVFACLDMVTALAFLAVYHIFLWSLGLIPLIGAVLAPVLGVAGGSLFLAHEFFGLPMIRHFWVYSKRWSFVGQNKALSFGFGASCFLLLWVPFLNLTLLPLCAVGGTLAVCEASPGGIQEQGELT